MSLTFATAATLPQQRTIFSLVAWSGATPLTVTVCVAPSYLTSRPSAFRPCEAMYFSIAWPAVALSAATSGARGACRAAGAALGSVEQLFAGFLDETDQAHGFAFV